MSNDTYLVPDLKKGEIHRTELTIKKVGLSHPLQELMG